MNLLPFIEPSNVSQSNPDLLQSLILSVNNNLDLSALLSLADPNNIQASPLPSNSDIPAAFLLPYLGNTSLF